MLITNKNGNFLGAIEMLSNFDPVIIERVKKENCEENCIDTNYKMPRLKRKKKMFNYIK